MADGLQLVGVLRSVTQNDKIPALMRGIVDCSSLSGEVFERQFQFAKADRDTMAETPMYALFQSGEMLKLVGQRVRVMVAAETRETSTFVNFRAFAIEPESPRPAAVAPPKAASA